MITLYGFCPFGEMAEASPFVLKIDAYLRLSGIEFELISDPRKLGKSPKKKLPIIVDQGRVVADSGFIIDYLQQTYGAPLEEHLSDEQLALQHVIAKTLEENLYWCLVWSRWISDEGWPIIKQTFFGGMPWPLRKIVPALAKKNVVKALHLQGMGRHSEAEIKQIARKDFQSLSTFLADKPYFFGSQPATVDAVAFAFLSSFILSPIDSSMNSIAREYQNLVEYCERFQRQWYAGASTDGGEMP